MTWSSDSTSVLLYAISRHALCVVVDIRSGVRREPRGDQADLQR
jgi:hypothetical protein